MKNLLLAAVLAVALSGCAMVSESIAPQAKALRPIDKLTPGMVHAEGAAIMDARVVIGYDIDPVNGVSKPIETRNLYATEMVDINGVSYQIDRYIIRTPTVERVTDSELYPVVYKDGILVTKGYEGLAELKARK